MLMDIKGTSDRGLQEALGSRLRRARLDADLTRDALAQKNIIDMRVDDDVFLRQCFGLGDQVHVGPGL